MAADKTSPHISPTLVFKLYKTSHTLNCDVDPKLFNASSLPLLVLL